MYIIKWYVLQHEKVIGWWLENEYVLAGSWFDLGRVHLLVLIFYYSIMAEAQYAFIIYSCIYYEKACRWVVVVPGS